MIDQSIELGVNNDIERQLNKLKRIIFKSKSEVYKVRRMNAEEIARLKKFCLSGFKKLIDSRK